MTKEFNKRDAHMIKTGFNEGIRKALIDELIILTPRKDEEKTK